MWSRIPVLCNCSKFSLHESEWKPLGDFVDLDGTIKNISHYYLTTHNFLPHLHYFEFPTFCPLISTRLVPVHSVVQVWIPMKNSFSTRLFVGVSILLYIWSLVDQVFDKTLAADRECQHFQHYDCHLLDPPVSRFQHSRHVTGSCWNRAELNLGSFRRS